MGLLSKGQIWATMCVMVCASCAPNADVGSLRSSYDVASTASKIINDRTGLSIKCDDSFCDERVGLIFVESSADREASYCTGALIGTSQVMTASHCVASQSSCKGVWWGQPKDGNIEWVACDAIEKTTTPQSLMEPDMAVLRLARDIDVRPFSFSEEKPELGSILRIVTVTPDRFDDRVHMISTRRCRVGEQPDVKRGMPAAAPNVQWLEQCPVRLGNSGAPLLDSKGKVIGLIHGGGPPFFAIALATGVSAIR